MIELRRVAAIGAVIISVTAAGCVSSSTGYTPATPTTAAPPSTHLSDALQFDLQRTTLDESGTMYVAFFDVHNISTRVLNLPQWDGLLFPQAIHVEALRNGNWADVTPASNTMPSDSPVQPGQTLTLSIPLPFAKGNEPAAYRLKLRDFTTPPLKLVAPTTAPAAPGA
jgi:hypothetical protein